MSYLIDKYKGKYKLLTPYDRKIVQFPRDLKGGFSDLDVYIKCQHNVTISYYGHSILEAYIPSIGRGNNIVKAINELDNNIITKLQKTDSEVIIQFKAKDMERLEPILKPLTSGANRSPFSNKNLPHNTSFKIPDEDLSDYKAIVVNLPKEKSMLLLSKITRDFISSLATKKNTIEDIKRNMAIKGLKGKEYIYSLGKDTWNKYLKTIKERINDEAKN